MYDANSKRISYISAGSKELVGEAINFFVVINSSLISKGSKIVRGAAGVFSPPEHSRIFFTAT